MPTSDANSLLDGTDVPATLRSSKAPPTSNVPLADPGGDTAYLSDEIAAKVKRVIDSGFYILGQEVADFEKALAEDVGVAQAIGVASGTDALVLGLLGLGVGVGDEVITVSHTAGATVAAIRMIGAIPVLVDVEDRFYCLDAEKVESAISPRTRAIIAVHLYGHPADMTAIGGIAKRHGIPIIEDCAQAQGATVGARQVGSLGDVGCFSFYPTKNLGAIGDGGAVVTDNLAVAERIRKLRTYGWSKPQYAEIEHGRCSRLDEIQAAILSLKLKSLWRNVQSRRSVAERYRARLAELPIILPNERSGCSHTYHLFVVRVRERDALQAHLRASGIGTARHYPWPVHRQPGILSAIRMPETLSVTDRISGEILSLPMFATITETQVDRVIEAVAEFYR